MIRSKDEAKQAIQDVCEWIRTQPTNPWDPFGGAMFEKEPQVECDDVQEIREWACSLLEAANADGRCGCRLCQS